MAFFSLQHPCRTCFRACSFESIYQLIRMQIQVQCPKINPLKTNDHYRGRNAKLTSKCCILYIYSTNIVTEYFKHGIYSPFFPLQNTVCFIILKYFVPVLFKFYIQTQYFKHSIYSPFFPLQNAVCFIILTYLVPVLFTFYVQGVLKLKKK